MRASLASVFRCFADDTRLRILHLLSHGPLCVCHVQEILGQPQVAVSKHLAYLRQRGLVTAERQGQWMAYSVNAEAPPEVRGLIDQLRNWVRSDPRFQADLRGLESLCCGAGASMEPAARAGVRAVRSGRATKISR